MGERHILQLSGKTPKSPLLRKLQIISSVTPNPQGLVNSSDSSLEGLCLSLEQKEYLERQIDFGTAKTKNFLSEELGNFLVVQGAAVTDIQKKPGLLQETVKVSTRSESWVFSMYNGECYDLIRQLANLGMRKLISEDSYHQDIDLLLKRSKNVPKKSSFLKRDLDARKDSEAYRVRFCLPVGEKLDGRVECFLFTPFNKKYRFGTLYLSCNFACFSSHVPGLVNLVLPLKDVNCIEKSAINANNGGKDEAIVFTMRRGGKTYVFGQVSDRDFVVEKLCELLSRL